MNEPDLWVSKVLLIPVGLALGVWSTWTGIEILTGGKAPLLGWKFSGSPVAAALWFVFAEPVVVGVLAVAAVAPVAIIEYAALRRRR